MGGITVKICQYGLPFKSERRASEVDNPEVMEKSYWTRANVLPTLSGGVAESPPILLTYHADTANGTFTVSLSLQPPGNYKHCLLIASVLTITHVPKQSDHSMNKTSVSRFGRHVEFVLINLPQERFCCQSQILAIQRDFYDMKFAEYNRRSILLLRASLQ
ncbi:hypothetical protein J6590_063319 [Homalodisca vitripennis]|nr:hypothetical protein J6590_063319 [Homalodisca vitripennis]